MVGFFFRTAPPPRPLLLYSGDERAILDDQTQVDLKPVGQPEHASLNQRQLIAANRPKLVLWAPPAGGGDKVSQ